MGVTLVRLALNNDKIGLPAELQELRSVIRKEISQSGTDEQLIIRAVIKANDSIYGI